MESVTLTILKKVGLIQEKKSLNLLNFNSIKAQTFFLILQTSNLLLLIQDEKHQQQENLFKKYKSLETELADRWIEIQEIYYNRTDKQSYENFISEQSYSVEQTNEMIIIEACESLMDWGFETYKKHLAKLGIEGTPEQIRSAIAQLKAKFNIYRENELAKNKKTADSDFYSLWGIATEHHGYFPSTVLLSEWCGIMSILKKKAESNKDKM